MKTYFKRSLLALVAVAGCLGTAQAAAYIKLDGIKGETTDQAFPDAISVDEPGFEADASRPGAVTMVLRKQLDKSSPLLAKSCANGQHIKSAKLFVRKSGDSQSVFAVLELQNVRITQVAMETLKDSSLVEKVHFVCESLFYRYIDLQGQQSAVPLSITMDTADGDGDGFGDAYEAYYGFDTSGNDADADPDNDGLTNLQEMRFGTDPTVGSSLPSFTITPRKGGVVLNGLVLSFDSKPGQRYAIEWSPNLREPFTSQLDVEATSPEQSVILPNTAQRGFWRVNPIPPPAE